MSYESIVQNIATMTESEQLNLISVIVNLLKDNNQSFNKNQKLDFPCIKKDFSISKQTMDMVIGKLPDNFDLEKESDKMWQEMSQ